MSKRRTWRWVTRDQVTPYSVEVWKKAARPRLVATYDGCPGQWFQNKDGRWDVDDFVSFDADEFKKLFGFTIPTDHPVKVEFAAKVVE